MKQLPQAMATGYIHMGTMTGKLNGVMPATTPSGWRTDEASTPVDTSSENSPFSRWGMPQANSTTSMPRATSPRASSSTLPCSAVIRRARSSRWRSASSRKANRIRLRAVERCVPPPGRRGPRRRPPPGRRRRARPGPPQRSALPMAGSNTGAVLARSPSTDDPIHFTVRISCRHRSSDRWSELLGCRAPTPGRIGPMVRTDPDRAAPRAGCGRRWPSPTGPGSGASPNRDRTGAPTCTPCSTPGSSAISASWSTGGRWWCPPATPGTDDRLFLHGSVASRSLRAARQPVPACVTVTHVDGLVLARSVFEHAVNYRCAMVYGTPEVLVDAEEKLVGLRAISDQVAPGQWEYARLARRPRSWPPPPCCG